MADYNKHRLEVIKISENFTDALDDGDSVSAVDSVVVTQRRVSGWTDASDEFGNPSGAKSGDKVNITLAAAAPGDQAAGDYRLRVKVSTANNETLISTPSLRVTDAADPDAP